MSKDPTAPQMCSYTTLWYVSVFKATGERKRYDFCNNTFEVRRPAARRTHWA